jgi:hypothetical protein
VARGWESKSVEDQQSEANSLSDKSKPQLNPEQRARQHVREGLRLARKSVLRQLTSAKNAVHRQMLESALADLDRRLEGLEPAG